MDGVPIHNLEEEDYHLVRGCDDSDSENDFIYNERMPQALLKEVRDLPGEDVDTDFPRDQGQIPSVDVNDRTRVNGTFKHLLRWLLIFLCLWAPFSSLSDNALEIACSGNYEEFGHELSSSGLLGSFGWTRVNLQMEAKGGVKQIVLTEEDIPGAKLPRGKAEECTVPQLRRWLLCRGAKTSGKKAELVKRFVCTMVFY